MKQGQGRKSAYLWISALTIALWAQGAQGAAQIKIDENRSLSIGAGLRSKVTFREGGGPTEAGGFPGTDSIKRPDFTLDNARVYLNAKLHKYIKMEFNLECFWCSNNPSGNDQILGRGPQGKFEEDLGLLDAILKFEYSPHFNVWLGRMLAPAMRAEMDGPFFGNVYENFKTPFYPQDRGAGFSTGNAGRFGRGQGVQLWGNVGPGNRLLYQFGLFRGLTSEPGFGPNQDDSPLYAGRVAFNFLNVEREFNPGYYTASTYYGKAGDVLTVGYAIQYQDNGAGSSNNPADKFLGMNTDVLFEKVLGDGGVFTAEGEYKYFEANFPRAAFADNDCFCIFDGHAYTGQALYLIPAEIGIGKPQPYVRYTRWDPDKGSEDREEFEGGLNYIINGHNASVSLFYQYGDLATKGRNFSPAAAGEKVNILKLAVQLQI